MTSEWMETGGNYYTSGRFFSSINVFRTNENDIESVVHGSTKRGHCSIFPFSSFVRAKSRRIRFGTHAVEGINRFVFREILVIEFY